MLLLFIPTFAEIYAKVYINIPNIINIRCCFMFVSKIYWEIRQTSLKGWSVACNRQEAYILLKNAANNNVLFHTFRK